MSVELIIALVAFAAILVTWMVLPIPTRDK